MGVGNLLDDAPFFQLGDELTDGLLGHAQLLGQIRAAHALGVQVRKQRGVGRPQRRRAGRALIHALDGVLVDQARAFEQQLRHALALEGFELVPSIVFKR